MTKGYSNNDRERNVCENYKGKAVPCEATVLMYVACRRSHSATSRLAAARAASIMVVSSWLLARQSRISVGLGSISD